VGLHRELVGYAAAEAAVIRQARRTGPLKLLGGGFRLHPVPAQYR
jgi:hypothetical protein